MTVHDLVNAVTSGKFDQQLRRLHGSGDLEYLRRRAQLISAAEKFSRLYPLRNDVHIFFAPKTADIPLKIGEFSISAGSEPAVTVVADFHGENMISLSAGELDGTLDLNSGETTGQLCNVLLDLYADFSDISGFDMVISSDLDMTFQEIEFALRAVIESRESGENADISQFFVGYSLCVTRVADVQSSPQSTDQATDMTADEFYEAFPEIMDEKTEDELLEISRYFEGKRKSELIAEAFSHGEIENFFKLIDQSSSNQPKVEIALHLSRRLLASEGASIAANGCILAFVPTYTAESYASEMERIFGGCNILSVGCSPAIEITD